MATLASGPSAVDGSAEEALKGALYDAFSGRSLPVVATGDAVMPAASIWTGSRLWVRAFREAGLVPGHRLVLALPPSPGFVQVLIASLWEGLTLAPIPADAPVGSVMERVGAAAAVTTPSGATPGGWIADPAGAPVRRVPGVTRPSGDGESSAGTALLLGAHAPGPPVRVSERDVAEGAAWAVQSASAVERDTAGRPASARPAVLAVGPRVRVSRPWHDADVLLHELLPALLRGAEVRSDPDVTFHSNTAVR